MVIMCNIIIQIFLIRKKGGIVGENNYINALSIIVVAGAL